MWKIAWTKAWLNNRIGRLYDVLFALRSGSWNAVRNVLDEIPGTKKGSG